MCSSELPCAAAASPMLGIRGGLGLLYEPPASAAGDAAAEWLGAMLACGPADATNCNEGMVNMCCCDTARRPEGDSGGLPVPLAVAA